MSHRDRTTEPEPVGADSARANLQAAERFRGLYEREGLLALLEHYDELFHPDATWSPAIAAFGSETYVGREGFRNWIEEMGTVTAEFTQTILSLRAVGDRHVLAFAKMRLIGKESGLSFEGDYAGLWEFDEGRLRSMRAFLSHAEAERAAAEIEHAGGGENA